MIIFYSMDGCGFCQKAKSELANDIASGLVIIKGQKEAPPGVNGFPHFVNEKNGKAVSGFRPREKLFAELEILSEGYHREYTGVNFFPHVSNTSGYRTLQNYNAPQRLTQSENMPFSVNVFHTRIRLVLSARQSI